MRRNRLTLRVEITEREEQKRRGERTKKYIIKREGKKHGRKNIRLKEGGNKIYFILCSLRWTLHAQTRHTRKF